MKRLIASILIAVPLFASRDFSGNTGASVNHGYTSNVIVGGTMTYWGWFKRTSDGTNQHIISKWSGGAGMMFACVNDDGEGQLRVIIYRTTNTDVKTVAGVLPLNTWTYIGVTFDDAVTPKVKIYKGTLASGSVAEVSYGTVTEGSGTIFDSFAEAWFGNLSGAPTNNFKGLIARGGIATSAFSLANHQTIHAVGNGAISGANLTGTQILVDYDVDLADYSGNARNGTESNTTTGETLPALTGGGSTRRRVVVIQ
jgi:hypothetical protein